MPSATIATSLRQRIVSGAFPRGSRLPNRVELLTQFNSTHATLQRAFDQLKDDGFVVARGKAGTFVSDSPPHLCHYAVLSPSPGKATRYPLFWHALECAAEQWRQGVTDRQITFSVVHVSGDAQSRQQMDRLIEMVESDRIAGLFLTSGAGWFQGLPIMSKSGVPRIAIGQQERRDVASLNLVGFFEQAVEYLKARGCRRIASVSYLMGMDHCRRVLREAQLPDDPWLIQSVPSLDVLNHGYAQSLAQLLLRLPRNQRIDGLIIADDNVVEPITQVIRDAGVRVPGELSIVAHANFPKVTPSVLPAHRIGYDVREILAAAVNWIDAARAGRRPPMDVNVQSHHEHDVAPEIPLRHGRNVAVV